MFWGLVLEPGKRYSTVVDKSFHVSMAALDCSSLKKTNEILKVLLHMEDQVNILCNLSMDNGILQEKLDLNFMIGDNITFECKGSGNVHLTGYLVPDDFQLGLQDEDLDEENEEESEESETDLPISTSAQTTVKKTIAEKRKSAVPTPQQNKKKKVDPELKSNSSADSDDDEEDEGSDEELDELESGDDEQAESEEESDEEEEDIQEISRQQKKKEVATPQNQPQLPGKQGKPVVNGVTPNQQQSGKKDKKKGQTPQTPAQNTATPKQKTPEDTSPKKKVLDNGVIVKDVKLGNGALAKNGKFVSVYYTGRLKSNNKVFDQLNKGDGFKFRLGKGEVIKGWDTGVNGMKVGGKRVITCPPNAAYGVKGSLPTIPPNSTLIFEVEVKAVN